MNSQQLMFGFIEFFLTIIISFVLIFLSYRLFLILTPRFDEEKQLKKKNTSVGLILGGILLGEAIIVKQAIYPVMAVIQIHVLGGDKGFASFLKTLGLGIGYIVLTAFLALASILLCFWMFNLLTPNLNQYEEIKENNVAVALFMAFFIICICLLLSSGISGLTKALIPFPEVGSIPLK